jgi:hypothetical protein
MIYRDASLSYLKPDAEITFWFGDLVSLYADENEVRYGVENAFSKSVPSGSSTRLKVHL